MTGGNYDDAMNNEISLGRALSSRRTMLAFAALLAAVALFVPANLLIDALYPERPIVPDIFFTLTPELPFLAYGTDPLLFVSMAMLLVQALKFDRRRLPYYLFSIAVLYFARCFLMVLTPLGRPTGNHDSYGIFEFTGILQHGMFPSGHQMLATLSWLLIDRGDHPRLRRAAGALALLEGAALLLSRGHYSIDIVGGSLVAWFIVERLSRYRDRFIIAPVE